MGVALGSAATLNRNTNVYATPTWSAISVIMDATQDLTMEEADASVRGLAGHKLTEPTQLVDVISFKMLDDSSDTNWAALRTAYFAKTVLDIMASSATATTSGALYTRADFKVFEFKRGEPINGLQTTDVTIKPCYSTHTPTQGTIS